MQPRPVQLVMGASGFLGSHVVRCLAARGERVRAMVRRTSDLRALDGLDVELVHGDVRDVTSVRAAMAGCDVVHYCVVDARPWLRDPSPMIATNVGVLPDVLAAAAEVDLRRFVFTGSLATIGIDPAGVVDETWPNNWSHLGGPYVESRVQAEDLVLRWARERSLPAVAMCVANTYGPRDYLPTPHGAMVYAAALGRMPFYVRGAGSEVVGVEDAAEALVLAADRGHVGERYIVSERWMSQRAVLEVGADAGGARPPRLAAPQGLLHAAGFAGEQAARLLRRDLPLTRTTARLTHVMTPLDHGKAVRELGWSPRPAPDAIRAGAEFYLARRKRSTYDASRSRSAGISRPTASGR